MNVPELMPRHSSYARRLRRRLQYVRQQFGFPQGIALRCLLSETFGLCTPTREESPFDVRREEQNA
jgi:hypothetical protein